MIVPLPHLGRQAEGLHHSSREHRPRNTIARTPRPVRARQWALRAPRLPKPIEAYPRLLKAKIKNHFLFPPENFYLITRCGRRFSLAPIGGDLSRLGSGERNLFRFSGTKVAWRPSERARASQRWGEGAGAAVPLGTAAPSSVISTKHPSTSSFQPCSVHSLHILRAAFVRATTAWYRLVQPAPAKHHTRGKYGSIPDLHCFARNHKPLEIKCLHESKTKISAMQNALKTCQKRARFCDVNQ
jgi:hypothetical protein